MKPLSTLEQQEIETLRKRIRKAERRIAKGARVAEETSRILRLKDRIATIEQDYMHVSKSRVVIETLGVGDYERFLR